MTTTRPLPGIRIEGRAEPLPEALPRMDIAVFVGFAASGPLHCPVAVEDVDQFELLFGSDLALPAAGDEPSYAMLAPSVRSFFRNGGRRCWVVRVANEKAAEANRFVLPGLKLLARNGSTRNAEAVARSEGSWSDAMRVSTTLTPFALRAVRVAADEIELDPASMRDVVTGDLLRVEWASLQVAMFFFVTERENDTVSGSSVWVDRDGEIVPAPAIPAAGAVVQRLTFELAARAADGRVMRLGGLGFAPAHPRYWAALPADVDIFEDSAEFIEGLVTFRPRMSVEFKPRNFLDEEEAEMRWGALWHDASHPRFPLAGPRYGPVYLPTTMKVVRSPEEGAMPNAKLALVRDGLKTFDSSLFIDSDLAGAGVGDLLARATYLRYEADTTRNLRGIHAALAIEEATIIAVPDAVHWPWTRAVDPALPPPNPPHQQPGDDDGDLFFDCNAGAPVPVPVLTKEGAPSGEYTLKWAPLEGAPGEVRDELLEALRPDFSDEIVHGASTTGVVTIANRLAGSIFYYRVRRTRGEETVLSNAVVVAVTGAQGFAPTAAYDDDVLVETHEALIRLAAARGDLVALLSLPRHYDEKDAIAHADMRRRALDAQVVSYAALAHPWPIARDEATNALRAVPPDGAMAGVMAARAALRGAWIAPANVPLRGVLSLTPAIAPAALQSLQDAAVNVVRHEPLGFVLLDSDTLSGDDDLRALNVRRLLILIRRAALRVGNRYVFEPNGEAARRAVRRAFESMLESMFLQGAFAGRTARSAFRVVLDDTPDARDHDRGMLIAELRVAPSRPLSFLTIRLLQSGGGSLTAQEGR